MCAFFRSSVMARPLDRAGIIIKAYHIPPRHVCVRRAWSGLAHGHRDMLDKTGPHLHAVIPRLEQRHGRPLDRKREPAPREDRDGYVADGEIVPCEIGPVL